MVQFAYADMDSFSLSNNRTAMDKRRNMRFALVLAAVVAQAVTALSEGVAVGENILNNPELLATEGGLPLNWNYNFEPNNGCMRIVGEGADREAVFSTGDGSCTTLWQSDIHLVPGATYKLGGWVKTKNLNASQYGLVITPWAWPFSIGPSIPADTGGEWKWIEKTFQAPESKFEAYYCGAYTVGHKSGGLSVRGLSLTAMDEAGVNGITRAPKISDYRRITPLSPRLEDVPEGDSTFLFAYMTPDRKPRSCRVWMRMDDGAERFCGDIPVVDGRFSVRLAGMKEGARGVLRAAAVCDGEIECSVRYDIAVRKRVSLSHPAERRLNNMVTRLLTVAVKDGDVTFSAERDGWVLVALDKAGPELAVCLDDSTTPLVSLSRLGGRFETMFRVSRGDHRLRLKGTSGGRLLVNGIPGLYCYSMPGNIKQMAHYAPYRGEFFTNRIYAVFNQFGYGYDAGFSKEEWDDFAACGKERVGHGLVWRNGCEGYTNNYESAELLAKRMRRWTLPSYTYDEVFITSFKPKWIFADAMRLLQNADSAPCVWSSGYHFPYTALDAEYYSACLNAAHGRGRFFFEVYPHFDSKEDPESNVYSMICETCDRARRLIPDGMKGSYFIMGLYTGIGMGLCYDTTCDYDPKWYYSRYVRNLVTLPSLDGLCGFGIYSYSDAEEEDVRWVCALVRHHLLAGRSDDFAASHGIEFDPRTVRNGNFANGLDGWVVEGDVRAEKVPGYAKGVQHRRYCSGRGDEVAVFRKVANGKSRLRQTMAGIVPGRIYALRYAVSPMKEIAKDAEAGAVRRYGLSAVVEGAEDVTAQMPIARYGGAERNTPKLNARTIVFKACGTSVTLSFALDDDGEDVEDLALSAVRIRPYFVD